MPETPLDEAERVLRDTKEALGLPEDTSALDTFRASLRVAKAAIATRMPQMPETAIEAVSVKPLSWEPNSKSDPDSIWTGEVACNFYYGIEKVGNVFALERGQFRSEAGRDEMGMWPTSQAARDAAQIDWNARLAPALAPAPSYERPPFEVLDVDTVGMWAQGLGFAADHPSIRKLAREVEWYRAGVLLEEPPYEAKPPRERGNPYFGAPGDSDDEA